MNDWKGECAYSIGRVEVFPEIRHGVKEARVEFNGDVYHVDLRDWLMRRGNKLLYERSHVIDMSYYDVVVYQPGRLPEQLWPDYVPPEPKPPRTWRWFGWLRD